jgi:hypothetical protein
MQRLAELESSPERRQHARERILERAGWIAIAGLLLLGCAGGLGPGAINVRNLQSSDGSLRIRLHAIERCYAPAEIVLWVSDASAADGPVVLSLSRELAAAAQLDKLVPRPQRLIREEDRLLLAFDRHDLPPSGQIRCRFEFEDAGIVRSEIGTPGGATIHFRQFILP